MAPGQLLRGTPAAPSRPEPQTSRGFAQELMSRAKPSDVGGFAPATFIPEPVGPSAPSRAQGPGHVDRSDSAPGQQLLAPGQVSEGQLGGISPAPGAGCREQGAGDGTGRSFDPGETFPSCGQTQGTASGQEQAALAGVLAAPPGAAGSQEQPPRGSVACQCPRVTLPHSLTTPGPRSAHAAPGLSVLTAPLGTSRLHGSAQGPRASAPVISSPL